MLGQGFVCVCYFCPLSTHNIAYTKKCLINTCWVNRWHLKIYICLLIALCFPLIILNHCVIT